MNAMTAVMAAFSMLGAVDRILGNRFGLGKEFEKGLMLLGNLALSMIGMIAAAPVLAQVMQPVFAFFSGTLHIDPSILPAVLFANDMGGAPMAAAAAADEAVGMFNAMVVSSMMGCTVSFTIPYALGTVPKKQQPALLLGLLYGLVTLPVGCFAAGLMLGLPLGTLLWNMLPLVVFSAVVALGLKLCPDLCVRVFGAVGSGIQILITIGLALAVLKFLTGAELVPGLGMLEEGAAICLSAAPVMTGAFPLLHVLSKCLSRPMKRLGKQMGMNEASVMGLLATLANAVPTFENMKHMNVKGVVLNAAFAVSASAVLADHLAFTIAFAPAYLTAVMTGKLISGVLAVMLAGRAKLGSKS